MKTLKNILGLHFSTVILFGLCYPLFIWGIGLLFPSEANGLPLMKDGNIIGFENEGQKFTDPKYFWGRPSASDYDANANSGGTNLGPTNPALLDAVKSRLDTLLKYNPKVNKSDIPIEMITSSGSGLDPHVSPQGAYFQVPRIAGVRHLDENALRKLITANIEKPLFGLFGTERVNVLKLNLALDKYDHK
ncbi:MAG: potassium-transporting ATPase subunit KdpC [Ignavibacteriaceae bacterium]|nr:potassium-transporting ATPase subunit KdpC [Ignavibacteriaceae bacterium]